MLAILCHPFRVQVPGGFLADDEETRREAIAAYLYDVSGAVVDEAITWLGERGMIAAKKASSGEYSSLMPTNTGLRYYDREVSPRLRLGTDEGILSLSGPRQRVLVFVSHSSKDRALSRAIVDAIKQAYLLNESEVMCTVLSEHGLAPGAAEIESIRQAVAEAKLLILVHTPNVDNAPWVPIEVGAAWGRGNTHIQVILAGGAVRKDIYEPISGKNPTDGTDADSMRRCIQAIGGWIGRMMRPDVEVDVGRIVHLAGLSI